MDVKAKSKYVRVSPTKLRPYADVVRGYTVERALAFLQTCGIARVKPLEKTIASAFANAQHKEKKEIAPHTLVIKEIRVDQGPVFRYFKPGAMGRASVQRKRLCHLEVILAPREQK